MPKFFQFLYNAKLNMTKYSFIESTCLLTGGEDLWSVAASWHGRGADPAVSSHATSYCDQQVGSADQVSWGRN